MITLVQSKNPIGNHEIIIKKYSYVFEHEIYYINYIYFEWGKGNLSIEETIYKSEKKTREPFTSISEMEIYIKEHFQKMFSLIVRFKINK